nr:immunoglobulin light chain junction region [Macaca mulatta]
CQQGHTDPPTF